MTQLNTEEHAGESSALLATASAAKPVPFYEYFLDRGLLPDFILRYGIRSKLSATAAEYAALTVAEEADAKRKYIRAIKALPEIALNTKEANEQHYEVPTEFFKTHLGPRMKYSCAFYNYEGLRRENGTLIPKATSLQEAEDAMLDLYVQRAGIKDGMSILELGCGWGSLCLYLAERFPNSPVTALSNSHGQRKYINAAAELKGIRNLTVLTGDMNHFEFEGALKGHEFDRIVSIEMFEHMKNYSALFAKVSRWLVPETGRMFVHVFCHKFHAYDFVTEEEGSKDSWMARYFFTGGTMPSEDLFLWFQDDLTVVDRWTVDGRNYGQTSEHWLQRLDASRADSIAVLTKAYGSEELGLTWFNRWRVFYLSCAELFNHGNGQVWPVVHYLFKRA
ncbi:S-adenosyl-L-methionine-dependent methyltransferase [Chytriomyces cf. hyalinus JEL632]|nr:S-adenosyl-L-methionine-dependent methyltransferase [Chytriomyces cf. hyalinus JEL632]